MGSANPRAFSRNKRGIAGSLVWINFDRPALLALINDQGGTFVANTDEIRPQYTITDGTFIGQSTIFNANITNSLGIPSSATIQQASQSPDYQRLSRHGPGHALGLGPDPALRRHPRRHERVRRRRDHEDLRRGNPERRLGNVGGRCCERDAVHVYCPPAVYPGYTIP